MKAWSVSRGFLAHRALTVSTLGGQCCVCFSLRPKKIMDGVLTFRCAATGKTGNDLAWSMQVDALDRGAVETSPNGFPGFTTSHECGQVCIAIAPNCGCCHQKFGAMGCRSGFRQLISSAGSGSADNRLEVSKGFDSIGRVCVFVVKLFQERTENSMSNRIRIPTWSLGQARLPM